MIDLTLYNLKLILVSVLILFIAILILLFRLEKIHKEQENNTRGNAAELKKRAAYLNEVEENLRKQKYAIWGKEGRRVLDEMKKINSLWKSRRERLRKGFWEKVEEEPDELKSFQDERDRIEELIRNTKAKYHKREIDEESFREIVKDYQKDLMEINLKIDEIENKRRRM